MILRQCFPQGSITRDGSGTIIIWCDTVEGVLGEQLTKNKGLKNSAVGDTRDTIAPKFSFLLQVITILLNYFACNC